MHYEENLLNKSRNRYNNNNNNDTINDNNDDDNYLAADNPWGVSSYPLSPGRIGTLNVGFLQREENWKPWEKTLGARTRTNNKLNSNVTLGPGIKPGPQRRGRGRGVSALATVPSLLPSRASWPCNYFLSFMTLMFDWGVKLLGETRCLLLSRIKELTKTRSNGLRKEKKTL